MFTLLILAVSAFAQNRIMSVHSGWRSEALYFAFDVPDDKLIGTRTEPLGQPWLDDSVAVYLNFSDITDKENPDEKCIRVVVSAAGGATVQRGGSGGWQDDTRWFGLSKQGTIRYGVKKYGEINNPAKKSEKYTVEIGLAWDLLGISAPPPGKETEIGFALSCHSANGNNITDYWPTTLNDANIMKPAMWGRMRILPNNNLIASTATIIPIPQMRARPFIDGVPDGGEWIYSSVINLALTPETSVNTPVPTTKFTELPVIAAWYITGEEKNGVCRPVTSAGKFATADTAIFHQRHFNTMTQYGIDAIIINAGDITPAFINAVVSAPLLKIPAPSIAVGITQSKLTDNAIAEMALAKISAIPAFNRLQKIVNGKMCYPVFIQDKNYVLLVSEGKVISKAVCAAISPAVMDGTNEILTRRGGEEFNGQLQKAHALSPAYIAINSYNDFAGGTAIAPTAQYGNTNLTTLFTTITGWRQNQKQTLQLTNTDLPIFLQRGTKKVVRFRIKNNTSETLMSGDGIRVEYKLLKKSQAVAEGYVTENVIFPANSYGEVKINISATDKKHRPLMNGDYTLEINIYSSPSSTMMIPMLTKKIDSFTLPIQIKSTEPPAEEIQINNENACKFIAIEIPDIITGPTSAVFTIANLSSTDWKKGQAVIKCGMTCVDGREIPGAVGVSVIDKDCPAGEILQQRVTISPPGLSGIFNCYFGIEINGKPANIFGAQLPVVRINTAKRWEYISPGYIYNTWCSYSDNNNLFTRADIDGKGNAFPTEDYLPDAMGINNAYPAGYQTNRVPVASDPWYQFPSSEKGRYPAIRANGQRIAVNNSGQDICIAAFAAEEKQNAEFIIEYKDGTSGKAAVSIPCWLDEPAEEDVPVFTTNHIKTSRGNNKYFNGTVYSIKIPADSAKEIAGLILPVNEKIYLTAITIDTTKPAGNNAPVK